MKVIFKFSSVLDTLRKGGQADRQGLLLFVVTQLLNHV